MIDCMRLSSKMTTTKVETSKVKKPEVKKETKQSTTSFKNTFNFDKPKDTEPWNQFQFLQQNQRQSFELTTLTNISKKEPKFPLLIEKESKTRDSKTNATTKNNSN